MNRAISIIVIFLVQKYTILAQHDEKTCGAAQLRATVIGKPLNFPVNTEAANEKGICKWEIVADQDQMVTFKFIEITFSAGNDTCEIYRMDLYNDEENSRNTITTVCGDAAHGDIMSDGNKMIVKMKYDRLKMDEGFMAQYMQVRKPGTSPSKDTSCGQLDLQASGQDQTLTFPDNGGEAPGPKSCTWTIVAEKNNVVQIKLIKIEFASNNDSCIQNMLMFFNGEVQAHKIITSVCGNGNHGEILSTDSKMVVVMSYTDIQKDKGFTAKYKQVNKRALLEATCGKSELQATDQVQTFIFPANGEAAPGPNSCTWTITSKNGTVVQLNLTSVEFAPTNDTCDQNKLEVYDGTVDRHKIITSVCGQGNHGAITSTKNKMIVVMKYHDIKQSKGFTAQYMEVNVASIPSMKTVLNLVLSLSVSMLNLIIPY